MSSSSDHLSPMMTPSLRLRGDINEIKRSLSALCDLAGKREVAWIRSEGEVDSVSELARSNTFFSSHFDGSHLESMSAEGNHVQGRNVSLILPAMIELSNRMDELSRGEPKLVEQYWKAWRAFNEVFAIDPTMYQPHFTTPNPALIRGSRTKEDIHSLLDCYALHYASAPLGFKELVVDFANQGLLAQALWVIKAKGLNLEAFAPLLSGDDYSWMQLQSFEASPSTPLDAMALNSHEGVVGLGWGYKSANLMKLQANAAQISRQCAVCHVEVPAFFPLGDREMQQFLKANYPDFDADWALFLESFPKEEWSAFIEANQKPRQDVPQISLIISPKGRDILTSIRTKILQPFIASSYITPQIQEWLDTQKPSFVIVRSTGKEDSATNSNAGGNASIPYVRPQAELISAAMGEVLASYFGEKSLLQRLAARDTSIFTEPPFMPLLIQEMISENVGGLGTSADQVPRSGVMFTQSEGKARGLTELYVGLGNNEGIVSSRVTTDHYLLDAHNGITKVVHEKGTRFVAVSKDDESYGCEPIENRDALLRSAPALPDSVAADMKRVADYFSKQYGQEGTEAPLDMEFTLKMSEHGGRSTLYLLQARPLVNVVKEHEPSYVDLSLLKESATQSIQGKVLLDGGAYVREVHSSQQILVSDTITQSLHAYLASPHQNQIKTVIIRKPAPGTSHEGVTFRSHGVAVIVVDHVPSFKQIEKYRKQLTTHPLLIDTQSGVVAQKPAEAQAICPGYVCYPIPLEYSMTPSKLICNLHHKLEYPELEDLEFEAQTKKLFEAFQSKTQQLISQCQGEEELLNTRGDRGDSQVTLHELIAVMAEGSESSAKLAAATLLHLLRAQLVNPDSKLTAPTRLELMMIIENISSIVETQLLPAASLPPRSLERLYPVRLLEACLFQKPSEALGAFSYVSCMANEKNQVVALKIARQLFERDISLQTAIEQVPFFKTGQALLKSENESCWSDLIKHLPLLPPGLVAQVRQLLMDMDHLGTLAEWSNVELVKLMKRCGIDAESGSLLVSKDQAEAFFTQLAAMESEGGATIANCKKIRSELATLQQQMNAWSDPQHIKKQSDSLVASFQNFGFKEGNNLPERYASCPLSFRLAYLKTLIQAVRCYDEIIKTCKASTHYSDDAKRACDVALLLNQYRIMMQSLLKTANQEDLYTHMGSTVEGCRTMEVVTYLDFADKGTEYTFGIDYLNRRQTPGFLKLAPTDLSPDKCRALLLPSRDFNVAAAVVGNQSDYYFSTIWPETLEDYFTFFHQNMEVCVSGLRTTCGFSKEVLPPLLESYCSMLIDDVATGGKGILSAISVEGPLIQVAIDVPLRQHAGKLLISYDRSHTPPIIRTKVEMFGNPEHCRWELTASCVALIGSDIPELRLSEKPEIDFLHPKSTIFEIETCGMNSSQARALTTFLSQLAQWSMHPTDDNLYSMAAENLRVAFGGHNTTLAAQDISQGAFYLSLSIASNALMMGKFSKAHAILTHVTDLLNDQPWIRELRDAYGIPFQTRHEELLQRYRGEVTRSGQAPEIPDETRREQFILTLSSDGMALKNAPDAFKNDPACVLAAVSSDVSALQFASRELRYNENFIRSLVEQFGHAFEYVCPDLQADKAIALAAVKQNGSALQFAATELRDDSQVVLAALAQNGLALQWASLDLQSQEPVIAAAIAQNSQAIQYAKTEKRM